MGRRPPVKQITPKPSIAPPKAPVSNRTKGRTGPFAQFWDDHRGFQRHLGAQLRTLWRHHRFALLLPLLVTFLISPSNASWEYNIKTPINPFDEGLLLVLRRFSSFRILPYRDLWTLYGPGQSLLAPLFNIIAGRNLLAHRLINILFLEAVVSLTYLLCAKFVTRSVASVFAIIVALISAPLPYVTSFLCLLSGIYLAFLPSQGKDGQRGLSPYQRVCTGTFLIGLSFLGRIDYGLLAGWALFVLLIFRSKRTPARWIRNIIFSSIAPGVTFLLYLTCLPGYVVIENFFRYPFTYYPLTTCRGMPVNWHSMSDIFFGLPFKGLWNEYQLVLVLGLVILPILGIILMILSIFSKVNAFRSLLLFLGGCDLFVFLSMLAKQGNYPSPTIPVTLLSLAVLSFIWGSFNAEAARRFAASAAVFLGFGIIPQFIPGALESWKTWPPYNPIVGFGERDAKTLLNANLYEAMAADLGRVTKPNEPIFVALDRNTGTFANVAALYWALDHPPASRFIEFDPCLTDREDVQERIVHDLAKVNAIITHNFWQQPDFANPPAYALDDYIQANFRPVRTYQLPGRTEAYRLLVRGRDQSTRQPLVANQSFEAGSLAPWARWSNNGTMSAAVECSRSHTGSCALKETGGFGITFQEVDGLVPGFRYTITAWAVSDSGTNANAALWVHDTTGSNSAIDGPRQLDGENWSRFTVTFLASLTGKVRIHLSNEGGSGVIYWDDVAVVKAP